MRSLTHIEGKYFKRINKPTGTHLQKRTVETHNKSLNNKNITVVCDNCSRCDVYIIESKSQNPWRDIAEQLLTRLVSR